ncbi:hypothetical protein HAX54_016237, partial [Datura stramonium]|nr:hypothetical protein [Datura stramonium]
RPTTILPPKEGGTTSLPFKCHKYQGFIHKMSECPNRRAFVVSANGLYCYDNVDVVEGVDIDEPKV